MCGSNKKNKKIVKQKNLKVKKITRSTICVLFVIILRQFTIFIDNINIL